jgi:BMFP domain-containing protein YqiC
MHHIDASLGGGRLGSNKEGVMVNAQWLEQLQRRVSEVLANSPAKDVEANLKAMLNAFFARLDLVTREEFDIQVEVLRRTREKLEQLEAKLAALERGGGPEA